MAPMDISGVMPNFKNPDHFTRSNTGIFYCTICPYTPKGEMLSFKTSRAALAHEQSSKHVMIAEVDDTWDMKPHDWPSEPVVDTSWMDPEQLKDVEHRQRIQEVPQLVGAWRSSCAEFMRDGTMLPVETPPNQYKVKRMKKALKAVEWKDLTRDDSNEVSAAEEVEPSSSSEDVDHLAVRTRAMNKAKAIRAKERAAQALADHAKGAPEGKSGADPLAGASSWAQPAYVPTPLPKTFPPVPLTPHIQIWMRKIAIDQSFSPMQTKRMREFLQLPTQAKINVIRESVLQLHALLLPILEQQKLDNS